MIINITENRNGPKMWYSKDLNKSKLIRAEKERVIPHVGQLKPVKVLNLHSVICIDSLEELLKSKTPMMKPTTKTVFITILCLLIFILSSIKIVLIFLLVVEKF